MAEQEYDFDLFTIGAGSGGVRASRIAGSYGAKVAIAEEHRYGRHLRHSRLRAQEDAGLRLDVCRGAFARGAQGHHSRRDQLRLGDLARFRQMPMSIGSKGSMVRRSAVPGSRVFQGARGCYRATFGAARIRP